MQILSDTLTKVCYNLLFEEDYAMVFAPFNSQEQTMSED